MTRRFVRTIRQRWENYSQLIPPESGAAQRDEIERAFYSGALSTLGIVSALADIAGSEAEETYDLQRLLSECRTTLDRLSYAESTKPPEIYE